MDSDGRRWNTLSGRLQAAGPAVAGSSAPPAGREARPASPVPRSAG